MFRNPWPRVRISNSKFEGNFARSLKENFTGSFKGTFKKFLTGTFTGNLIGNGVFFCAKSCTNLQCLWSLICIFNASRVMNSLATKVIPRTARAILTRGQKHVFEYRGKNDVRRYF